jgi:hypothetical protein
MGETRFAKTDAKPGVTGATKVTNNPPKVMNGTTGIASKFAGTPTIKLLLPRAATKGAVATCAETVSAIASTKYLGAWGHRSCT